MKVFIVVPAYNEENSIKKVIVDLKSHGYEHIVVVADGSADDTYNKAQETGVYVLKHMINCGAGAATKTGIDAALILGADIVVTFDGDGQHSAKDIKKLLPPIQEKKVEVVIGSRFLQKNKIPIMRRVLNFLGNILTFMLGGVWVSDSQSGLKAFSRMAAKKIEIHTSGFEFCSEIMRNIAEKNLSYKEVPIDVLYSTETMAKGQNFANGIKTGVKLVLRSLMK